MCVCVHMCLHYRNKEQGVVKTGSGVRLARRPCAHWQGVALALSELGAGRALSRKGRGSAAPLQDRVAAGGGCGAEASKAAGRMSGDQAEPRLGTQLASWGGVGGVGEELPAPSEDGLTALPRGLHQGLREGGKEFLAAGSGGFSGGEGATVGGASEEGAAQASMQVPWEPRCLQGVWLTLWGRQLGRRMELGEMSRLEK